MVSSTDQDKDNEIKSLKKHAKQQDDALKAEKRALEGAKNATAEMRTKAASLEEDLKSVRQQNLELRSQLTAEKEGKRKVQESMAERKSKSRRAAARARDSACSASIAALTHARPSPSDALASSVVNVGEPESVCAERKEFVVKFDRLTQDLLKGNNADLLSPTGPAPVASHPGGSDGSGGMD